MPVYRNTDDQAHPFHMKYGGRVAAGATVTIPRFIWPIPQHFELTSEDGASEPWVTLVNGAIPAEALTDLAQYKEIIIANTSGAALSIQAHGDTTNTGGANLRVLANGEIDRIENTMDSYGMRDFNSLLFSGTGTDDIIVTALPGKGQWQE